MSNVKASECRAKNPATCTYHGAAEIRGDFLSNFKFKRTELITGLNDLQTLNPTVAQDWHPTLNKGATPSTVKALSAKKAWWQCKEGHEWEAKITDRNTGKGCSKCGRVAVEKGINDLKTVNPCLAEEWHPTENGDLTPDNVKAGSRLKVSWLGQCGHTFKGIIGDRNAGNGCSVCSGRELLVGFNDLAQVNPDIAKQWHPTENDGSGLTPRDVRANDAHEIAWQCPTKPHHVWRATVASRNAGSLCPHCPIKTSKAEEGIRLSLEGLGYQCQSSNRKILEDGKEIDIVVEDYKSGIEYHGVYWHSERRGKKAPDYHYNKWALAKKAGYELIQIWEDDNAKNPELVKATVAQFIARRKAGTSSPKTLTGRPISESQAESFLKENYLKGFVKGSHYYGSTDTTGNLKSVLVLGKARRGTAEIKAYVNGTTESSDLSALLKQAAEAHEIKSFTSTVDNCEAMGSLYESNGFRVKSVLPSDFMYLKRGVRVPKDDIFVTELLGRVHPKDHERALESQNIDRIWDAGKTVFKVSMN